MNKEKLLVRKLVGLNKKLLLAQIQSFDNYISGDLKVIGFPGFKNFDCIVKEKLTFDNWLVNYKKYPVIKVEGIEKMFGYKKSIHLFYHQKSTYSFNWHTDNVNVLLSVLSGEKIVYLKNRKFFLTKGQKILIPKKNLHKVFSFPNTLALSIEL